MTRNENCRSCGTQLIPAGHWGICPNCEKTWLEAMQPKQQRPELLEVGKPATRPTA